MTGKLLRTGALLVTRTRPSAASARNVFAPAVSTTGQSSSFFSVALPSSQRITPFRPRVGSSNYQTSPLNQLGQQKRSIFIQTETTPNVDALKFLPNREVKPAAIASPFIEYLTPRSTIAPPYPSPLASKLMDVDGVSSVFYGSDFITVTKASDANWAHIKPEVFALITEAVTSAETLVNVVDKKQQQATPKGESEEISGQEAGEHGADSLAYDESDSEVVGMIKELLDTRIRPAIQEDGGDVEFCGFQGGLVKLKLRGACRTCDSSTVTLKDSIERMLMHYIEDVEGVTQILDNEEQIAIEEFAKFEEKLKEQRGKREWA